MHLLHLVFIWSFFCYGFLALQRTGAPITFLGSGTDGNSANFTEGSIADIANKVSKSVVSIVTYTKSINYGKDKDGNEVSYQLSTYNKAYVYGYQKWMKEKTAKYMAELSRFDKYGEYGGLTPGEWNYIERYL